MRYVVDRIEGDYAILENLDNRAKKEIALNLLPNIRENDILVAENGNYKVDLAFKKDRKRMLEEKLKKIQREGS